MEGTCPHPFHGAGVAGQSAQYHYRFYEQTGNYLSVDNAGMLYILWPYTGNTLKQIGEVNSLLAAITAWEARLPQ